MTRIVITITSYTNPNNLSCRHREIGIENPYCHMETINLTKIFIEDKDNSDFTKTIYLPLCQSAAYFLQNIPTHTRELMYNILYNLTSSI